MYSKLEVVDYMWQYSRSYGNKLGNCERYYNDLEGCTALVVLFEVAESVCKSVIGDYENSFYNIVEILSERKIITKNEKNFLSLDRFSLRKIRNIFAHDNLSKFNVVRVEDGREIYYPLSENESCLILYEILSDITYNILLNIISSRFIVDIHTDLEELLLNFRIDIKELSAEENLKILGFEEKDILNMKMLCDENELSRLAENSSTVGMYKEVISNLIKINE